MIYPILILMVTNGRLTGKENPTSQPQSPRGARRERQLEGRTHRKTPAPNAGDAAPTQKALTGGRRVGKADDPGRPGSAISLCSQKVKEISQLNPRVAAPTMGDGDGVRLEPAWSA